MRQQLAEIKGLTKENQKEVEMLESRHKEQRARMEKALLMRLAADEKKQAKETEAVASRVSAEREAAVKKMRAEADAFAKQRLAGSKAQQKNTAAAVKQTEHQYAEAAAERARQEKENEKAAAAEDSVSALKLSKKVKAAKKDARRVVWEGAEERQASIEQLEIKLFEMREAHGQEVRDYLATRAHEQNKIVQEYTLAKTGLGATQARQIAAFYSEKVMREDMRARLAKFDVDALKQKQEVAGQQLEERFALEVEQQKRQQLVEQRDVSKELRQEQKRKLDEFVDKQKEQMRASSDKHQTKAEQKASRDEFVRSLQQEEMQKQQNIRARMLDEDRFMNESHQIQRDGMQQNFAAQMQQLLDKQQAEKDKMDEEFQVRLEGLIILHSRDLAALYRDFAERMIQFQMESIQHAKEMRETHHSQERDLMVKGQTDFRALIQKHHDQEIAYMQVWHNLQLRSCDTAHSQTMKEESLKAIEHDAEVSETKFVKLTSASDRALTKRLADLEETLKEDIETDTSRAQGLLASLNTALQKARKDVSETVEGMNQQIRVAPERVTVFQPVIPSSPYDH